MIRVSPNHSLKFTVFVVVAKKDRTTCRANPLVSILLYHNYFVILLNVELWRVEINNFKRVIKYHVR